MNKAELVRYRKYDLQQERNETIRSNNKLLYTIIISKLSIDEWCKTMKYHENEDFLK